MEKIVEGKGEWWIRDGEAWEAAAQKAANDGYERRHCDYRGATFHKDGVIFALFRNLGVLNWHLDRIADEAE